MAVAAYNLTQHQRKELNARNAHRDGGAAQLVEGAAGGGEGALHRRADVVAHQQQQHLALKVRQRTSLRKPLQPRPPRACAVENTSGLGNSAANSPCLIALVLGRQDPTAAPAQMHLRTPPVNRTPCREVRCRRRSTLERCGRAFRIFRRMKRRKLVSTLHGGEVEAALHPGALEALAALQLAQLLRCPRLRVAPRPVIVPVRWFTFVHC